jgi:hypothetical protein
MSDDDVLTGGCLCRAVRYEARGEPLYSGHCYCADCRKVSGSGFIPFFAFLADQVMRSGETFAYMATGRNGGKAIRHHCKVCGGLVFGTGESGPDFRIYAGSLDDLSRFHPTIAIFTEDRPEWAMIPEGLAVFKAGPPMRGPE